MDETLQTRTGSETVRFGSSGTVGQEGEVLSVVHLLAVKIDRSVPKKTSLFSVVSFLAVKIDRSVPKMHVSKMKN